MSSVKAFQAEENGKCRNPVVGLELAFHLRETRHSEAFKAEEHDLTWFFFNVYVCMYLTASGLSCSMQAPECAGLVVPQHVGS